MKLGTLDVITKKKGQPVNESKPSYALNDINNMQDYLVHRRKIMH